LCTSWNWVVLTDFAPYKPVTIPDDDPTDFQYFFDAMGRNSCYVAPERFVVNQRVGNSSRKAANATLEDVAIMMESTSLRDYDFSGQSARLASTRFPKSNLLPSMDVFSLGCTMAEVFLDGEPLLDLPGMLRYISAASNNKQSGFERLDQADSPAKAALQKISNKLVRQVS